MVRKLQNFQVQIDENRQVFYPGEQVRGAVVVDVAQPMKCKKIDVMLVGMSYCHWTTTTTDSRGNSSTHTNHHRGYQPLVNLQGVLFGGSSTGAVQHPASRHTYHFIFNLPSSLPSSFEGALGHIRYYIEAKVVRPWKSDHKIRKPFTVNEIIDINLPQYSTTPAGTTEKRIGCLCCVAGNLNMRASLDRSGYCPGEQMFLNASCENESTREMLCMRAILVQNICYRAGDGKTRRHTKAIIRFEGEKIPRRSQDSWNNQPFFIPPVPPTIQTNPVSVSYQVNFDVRVPWGHNPKIVLGITIGTVPFQQSYGRQSSYQLAENQHMEPEFVNWMLQTTPVLPSVPPSSALGYPDMPPPSYAVAVGGCLVNVGDTEDRSNFGDQSYMPMYTYAQPCQGQYQTTTPSGPSSANTVNPLPYSCVSFPSNSDTDASSTDYLEARTPLGSKETPSRS